MTKTYTALRKEYKHSFLDESTLDKNPYKQFASWFHEAEEAGLLEPNAMVLSTCGADGRVSGRVVLLKGLDHQGFLFFSNYGSRKGVQLMANRSAALTFPWLAMERQVRVEGTVARISRRESVKYFNSRPADSRISACISPQSSVIPDRQFLMAIRQGFLLDLGGRDPRCPNDWGGYRLKPETIEFWQGREHRLHDRLQYRKNRGGWIIERLAP